MKKMFALLLCFAFMFPAVLAIPADGEEQLAELQIIKEYLDTYHLYPTEEGTPLSESARELENDPTLMRSIVDAWLSADRYGHFMTAEEYAAAFPQETMTVGIGIMVDLHMPVGTYVSGFLEHSSAIGSGMEVGCQIVSVDGVDVTDKPFLEFTRPLIAGNVLLSTVEISYLNPGSTVIHTETFTRNNLNLPPHVSGYMQDDETGYIRIEQFGGDRDFYDYFELYNETLPAEGATRVMIDLRGNPGGELNTLLEMLNCMMPEEDRLLIRMLYRDEQEEFYSTGQDSYEVWQPQSITVLIDGDSYSASEVFAGTLQGLGMARVVGLPSGGKSRAQYHLPFDSGDVLVFTYSDIELEAVGSYDEKGIQPDDIIESKTVTGADMDVGDLGKRAMYRFCRDSGRIRALEQRLQLLGYFRAEPDGVMDEYTFWCFGRFQAAMGRASTIYIGRDDLTLLESVFRETEFVAEDAQLSFALSGF